MNNIYKSILHPDRILPYMKANYPALRDFQSLQESITEEIDFRRSRVCIISFPKAGRTWLRVLLGKLIQDAYGVTDPNVQCFLNHQLTARAGIRPIHINHDGIQPFARTGGETTNSKKRYASKKVLLIVRDVRDIMVSYYYHILKRYQIYDRPISEFIRSERFGVIKPVSFYKSWYDNQHIPREFLLVRYEDLHLDVDKTTQKIVSFLELDKVTNRQIVDAIAFSSFENMQKLENSGKYQVDALSLQGDIQDINSRKVRKGKIGGYSEELNQNDLDYIDEIMQQINGPRDWLYYTNQPTMK